ncbi:DUF4175 family protein [Tenacibaculum caenipelagi]|uniref:Uncharacterized protein DUF4175 n=1 Tax=Tenacibaculum caenipelagi TaxID=1325435 RepID=A0A4V3D389_9FLAO|nr:DUF4175 family protein [Tenacibaculum caenipelagi]TDQ28684.1 uncharacterized protein DUF4175 [Tenacibaculum caenipelagi]
MGNFNKIQQKLQQFSRKYYTNELIKGSILFVSLGLIYLFFTLFIEYFLWLKPTSRTILFWFFIAVELFLLFRFICFPIFKIMGLQKGISFEEASKIIGNHFPEVKDKLLNVLQLQQTTQQSDLLVASIEQKSKELQPIYFNKAINFNSNKKYLKYILIPIFIWMISLLTGTTKKLSESFNRVVHHSVAYSPPAPFYFDLTAKELRVIKGKDITVYLQTKGEVIPQEAKIHFNNQQYFLKNEGNGLFSYTFSEVQAPITFYASANGIDSQEYQITIINTPSIQNISLNLQYPSYIKKANETIQNTGNLIVPQGTIVTWNIKTSETDTVNFINKEKREIFLQKENNQFEFKKQLNQSLHYQITTSNNNLKDYEQLQFSINVIKDEYPTISVNSNIDSITRGNAQFVGQITDDYGFKNLEVVFYDKNNTQNTQNQSIKINKKNIQTFYFEFPGNLNLQKGVNYEMYFQVYDNDLVNGSKKTMSKKFSYRQKTEEEVEEELLQEQKNHIENFKNSLDQQQKSKKELEKIQFDLQNKKNINWNDQKKIQNLVKRQEQYKQMMQRQTQKLQENFSEKKEENQTLQEKKENLQKRIEELKKLEKQQKLLDELMKLADKLNKEDLIKKTKELAEQNKQQERSLERILEMTKRFYVEQKMNQLANKLDELSKKQEELSKKDISKDEQKEINKAFQETKNELKELQKDNEKLKQPMDIPSMENLEKQAQEELNKAEENLENNKQQNAKQNQKKAAEKMQQMSQKMQQSMQSMSAEMEEENMEGLRQILENLITFSFDQEALMNVFSSSTSAHPDFGKNLQKQYQLKTYFEHIDDSLFVLSMRVPSISSKVQDQLAQAHYNLDQSLENFADNFFQNGISNQQYVMTSANTLADMLSNTLDAMQNPKPGNGKGKGKGKSFSLPDIIQQQNELMKKMKEGMQKQNEGKPKDGKEGKKEGGEGEQNDDLDGELYQIYKEQSQLREQLENAIKEGNNDNKDAKKALKKMEELENEILEKGFTQESIDRMQRLNYELLKLDKATFEQNREKQRKSNTNFQEFNNTSSKELKFKKLFYNQTEILNRQSLPLRQNYKKKVQEYFSLPKNKE